MQNRNWAFQENQEAKGTKQNCWYIVGNSWDTSVLQHIKKLRHVCLKDKLAIVLHKEDNILNKRSEIISKCRHSIKYKLANYDTKG